MDHLLAIKQYIQAMAESSDYHLVIVEGPPGLGKTTAVQKALSLAGLSAVHLSTYSTTLNLYNSLAKNSNSTILIDDCAGIFNDQASMAILKAATFSGEGGPRTVRWGSSSSRKVLVPEFAFSGKFCIVCNSFPDTADGRAIKSRAFAWKIEVTAAEAKGLLMKATENIIRFPNTALALTVARYLCDRITDDNVEVINFRLLGKGYDLAKTHPGAWEKLLAPMLPTQKLSPLELVLELEQRGLKVKDQAVIFEKETRLKVRSFYKYRREAGLSRC